MYRSTYLYVSLEEKAYRIYSIDNVVSYIYIYIYVRKVLIKIHEECISSFISTKSPENSRSTKRNMDSDPTGLTK